MLNDSDRARRICIEDRKDAEALLRRLESLVDSRIKFSQSSIKKTSQTRFRIRFMSECL